MNKALINLLLIIFFLPNISYGASLLASGQACANTSATTTALNTTGATLLVAVVTYTGTPTISDSLSNTWTGLTAQANTGVTSRIYYVNSATPNVGSSQTFTISPAGAGCINVMAFNGTGANPFDQQNGSNNTGVSSIQPGSITPTQANEIIISGVSAGNTMTTVTINSSMTITNQAPLTGGVNYGSGAAYLLQGTAAAINPTWTFQNGVTSNVASTIASFKTLPNYSLSGFFNFFMR